MYFRLLHGNFGCKVGCYGNERNSAHTNEYECHDSFLLSTNTSSTKPLNPNTMPIMSPSIVKLGVMWVIWSTYIPAYRPRNVIMTSTKLSALIRAILLVSVLDNLSFTSRFMPISLDQSFLEDLGDYLSYRTGIDAYERNDEHVHGSCFHRGEP